LCIEFGKTDDIDAMVAKFLCAPIKMKTLKDPNKPKRAKSAYLFYCADQRPKILEKLRKKKQKINIADVSKKLGAMWGALDDKAKTPYTKSAEKDRNRYKDEMEQYSA